ncbi:MAG: tRNA pseudouridine synthase A, partial [Granulicatella sp.]
MGFRYKVILSYDGTNYVGFQVQENGNSIQAELNKALRKMTKGLYIPVCGSGRTDSGVHANGQVIHFDYPTKIEEENLQRALNSLLPDDICAKQVMAVSDEFHARYSVTGKRYIYRVNIQKFVNPFSRLYTLHHPY